MAGRKAVEPQLCPGCKLKVFLPRVKAISYTRTPTIESSVKRCSKLRRYALDIGMKEVCKYFPLTERINGWLGRPRKKKRRRTRK